MFEVLDDLFKVLEASIDSNVSDPDWIQIQSGQWIRIRILTRNPDPDPGGQK